MGDVVGPVCVGGEGDVERWVRAGLVGGVVDLSVGFRGQDFDVLLAGAAGAEGEEAGYAAWGAGDGKESAETTVEDWLFEFEVCGGLGAGRVFGDEGEVAGWVCGVVS